MKDTEQKMYKIFKIDKCFEEYSADYDYVGGESIKDILNHFKEIYPDSEWTVTHEDWMDEYEWQDECENGKYKEGDIKYIPYFNKKQMEAFNESLNDEDEFYNRIVEVEHMFTDTPYVVLDGFGYCE